MNCNPFTLGHQYLIEKASERVEFLYIFVVSEDKSCFRFKDRIKMVELGTKHIKNVRVLPSGGYIISTATLPGYFNKDNLQNVKLDATADLEIFGGIIAKYFNINVRFAGEEPIDLFTRQYNRTMKRLLPEYGVEFIEIPRICEADQVISASRVRECMKENDYAGLKKLVPDTTYKYLCENYKF